MIFIRNKIKDKMILENKFSNTSFQDHYHELLHKSIKPSPDTHDGVFLQLQAVSSGHLRSFQPLDNSRN